MADPADGEHREVLLGLAAPCERSCQSSVRCSAGTLTQQGPYRRGKTGRAECRDPLCEACRTGKGVLGRTGGHEHDGPQGGLLSRRLHGGEPRTEVRHEGREPALHEGDHGGTDGRDEGRRSASAERRSPRLGEQRRFPLVEEAHVGETHCAERGEHASRSALDAKAREKAAGEDEE